MFFAGVTMETKLHRFFVLSVVTHHGFYLFKDLFKYWS